MRERRQLRPLAERVTGRLRPDGRSAALAPADEGRQERALRALLDTPGRSEPVPGRLVMICGSLQPGGAERQLANAVRGLARRGIGDVSVLCAHLAPSQPEQYDFFRREIVAAGGTVRQIRRSLQLLAPMPPQLRAAASALPAGIVCDVADLWRELVLLRPAVVHAWLDWSNIRAGIAAVLAGVPRILLAGRNLNPSHFVFHEPVMRPAYRALLSRPEILLVNNSSAGAQDYAAWLDVALGRIAVVHNGFCRPVANRDKALAERRRIGVPNDALLVGSMFRFAPEKRPLLWLDAAAAILEQRTDAMFVLYGTGPLTAQMRERASSLGLEPRLRLPGLSLDPVAAIGGMDVLVLTSEAEGTPNVVIEAQWAGTPVITCAAGGVAEAFVPGETGILVPSADPRSIAEATLRIGADLAWRERVRRAGPAFVASRFGFDRMADALIAQYGFGEWPRGDGH